MGSAHSSAVDQSEAADAAPIPTLNSQLQDDPVNWELVRQSLRRAPEQACLYAQHVEPSPLYVAVSTTSCPPDVAETLIDAYEEAIDQQFRGETILHTAAGSASGTDGALLIRLLVSRRRSMAKSVDRDGLLPLHRCRTSVGGAEALIRAYPEGVKQRCRHLGSLPLHYALMEEEPNVDLCRLLVKHSVGRGADNGATPSLPAGGILTRNKKGQTPLSILIKHLDPTDEPSVEPSSPTSSATSTSAETPTNDLWDMLLSDWLPLLMEHGAQIAVAKGQSNHRHDSANNENGHKNNYCNSHTRSGIPKLELHTLVENACCHSKYLMDLALDRYGHQAMERDYLGRTPLHIAAEVGSCSTAEALESLLLANPKAPRMTDNEGRLPIDWAAESPHIPLRNLGLLIKGEPRAVDTRDLRDGRYPFLSAAMGEQTSVNNTYYLLRAKPHVLGYFHLP